MIKFDNGSEVVYLKHLLFWLPTCLGVNLVIALHSILLLIVIIIIIIHVY